MQMEVPVDWPTCCNAQIRSVLVRVVFPCLLYEFSAEKPPAAHLLRDDLVFQLAANDSAAQRKLHCGDVHARSKVCSRFVAQSTRCRRVAGADEANEVKLIAFKIRSIFAHADDFANVNSVRCGFEACALRMSLTTKQPLIARLSSESSANDYRTT